MNLSDYWLALRRRMVLFALVVASAAAGSVAIALSLPRIYSATATILVESQQIPVELARSTVTSNAEERLEVIKRRVMTRDNLLDLARRFNIVPDIDSQSPADVVELMRKSTQIESILVQTGGRRGPIDAIAFTVTFAAKSAGLSAGVTNEIVNIILNQDLRLRTQRASETYGFFKKEEAKLATQLDQLEVEIAQFKTDNEMAMPASLEDRWLELRQLRERAIARREQLFALDQDRQTLQRSLSPSAGAGIAGRVQSVEEQELRRLVRILAEKRGIYAETHPDIKTLVARIAALEALVGPGRADDGAGAVSATPARAEIENQIASLNERVDILSQERVRDEFRQAELEAAISRAPEVERAYNKLVRAYNDAKARHEAVTLKLADAATGERLEADRYAERFELIEPALVPEKPISPKRKLIVAGGVGGGIALALALVILLELMNRTIRTSRDMERVLGITPVSAVPLIESARDLLIRRMRRALYVVVAVLGVAVVLLAIDSGVMPLEQIVETLGARYGLTGGGDIPVR